MRLFTFMLSFVLLGASAGAQLTAPSAVEAIAIGPREVKVYWNAASGAAKYVIRRDGVEIGSVSAETRVYTDPSAQLGHTYRYEVGAVDALGMSKLGRPYIERAFAELPDRTDCDVLVVGATTAGVAAAVTSARYGLNVVLIEETRRLGGMPVNGLGATDLRRLEHSSGFFEEFRLKVQSLYDSGDGLKYAPRIAHQAVKDILWAESRLVVHRQVRPVSVRKVGDRIAEVIAETVGPNQGGRRVVFRPRIVVDATECGDVAAWAGAPFRVGREPRSMREPHAGHLFYDRAGDKPLPGSTGRGDRRVQAYAYLMTVQDFGIGADKTIPRPPGYNPRKYEHAPKWEQSWAASSGKLPNGKFEVNQHPQGSDLQVINYGYPTAKYATRRRIEERFKNHALGYLYYLQTVEGKRNIGLSEDDYRDSDNWPPLLYIREARRFEGARVLDETDISSRPLQPNVIGLGDYPMDSHAVQPKTEWSTPDMGEGEFYLPQYTPWHQAPYDLMIPRGLSNLFTPTAISATHVAYGTLRLEPVRMHFGEAAGIASYLSLRHEVTPRDVPARQIQDELVKLRPAARDRPAMDGIGAPGPSPHPALLYAFTDVKPGLRKYRAIEWLAARGFFLSPPPPMPRMPDNGLTSIDFDPDSPATEEEAARLLNLLVKRSGAETIHAVHPGLLPATAGIYSPQPLTRIRMAGMLAYSMGWKSSGSSVSHYADLTTRSANDSAETLFFYWIDPGLWDDWPRYAPDGRMLFRPDVSLTRAQLAELIYLAHMYAGPLWEDFAADRVSQIPAPQSPYRRQPDEALNTYR